MLDAADQAVAAASILGVEEVPPSASYMLPTNKTPSDGTRWAFCYNSLSFNNLW